VIETSFRGPLIFLFRAADAGHDDHNRTQKTETARKRSNGSVGGSVSQIVCGLHCLPSTCGLHHLTTHWINNLEAAAGLWAAPPHHSLGQ